MGVVEEVGAEVTNLSPGDRVVIPFQISCGSCFMCGHGLQTQCETTQVREQGTGAALFGYSRLYGQVPGGQAEYLRVPQAQYTHIKVPDGPPDERFVYLSDVLPTAWQAVAYADVPAGGSLLVLGLGPIGDMATRIALHRGDCRVIAVDLVPERLERARARGAHVIDLREHEDDLGEVVRELTDGRGADSVVDAVGMEAHGSPVNKTVHLLTSLLPDAVAGPMMEKAGVDRLVGPVQRDRRRPPRRDHLAQRGVRRHGRPDADAAAVRQAGAAADGAGQRQALGRRHPPAAHRRRPARRRAVRHPPAPAGGRAPRPTTRSRRRRTAWSRWSCGPDVRRRRLGLS